MTNEKICAFIDILGFSNIVRQDINGALELLRGYQEDINMRLTDERIHTRYYSKYERDQKLRELYQRMIIDTFEYFIPFSDAVFIVADNADKFVFQISNHLLGSFMLGGYIYDDHHSTGKDDLLRVGNSKRKWYPLLFKGGITYGSCVPIKIKQITGSKIGDIYNVFGTAVLESVRLEELVKGPRLFCTAKFYNRISNDDSKRMVVPSEIDNVYEVLWPMPHIVEKGINGYKQLLEISINLWKRFNHEEFGFHYFRFVELVTKSVLETCRNNPDELNRVKQTIGAIFDKKSVDIKKISVLVEKY